jgi:type IV secretion system protein VirB4
MTTAALRYSAELGQDSPVFEHIPYSVHLTPTIVGTHNRDYVMVMRVAGVSFESADDDQVNNWHARLNILLRGLSSPHLAIWKHLVRREVKDYPQRELPPGFARELDEEYAARMNDELLYLNEIYLTIVYRPQTSKVGKALFSLVGAADADTLKKERADSLEAIEKAASTLEASLRRYDPERLGAYTHNGMLCSETKEYFGFLLSGEWKRMPLTRSPINRTVMTARPIFGRETIEIRRSTTTEFSAMLGIMDYPAETMPGFLNSLLTVPFEFVLTQSFQFSSKQSAKYGLKTARNRKTNAADDAVSQVEEIDDALDELQSNKFVMGGHHFSLHVKARVQAPNDEEARLQALEDLADNLAMAEAALADGGITVAREDLALEAAFYAQLPANFDYRPRVSPITSKNFAGFSPMHNFPTGRKSGNHWGEALMMLITAAGTPYYMSYHASNPRDEDGGTKKDVGHAMVLGPNGSGKTMFIAFSLVMLQAFGVTSVLFTKDRDTEIVIRALGGTFYPIEMGVPTGWAPLQLDPTPGNIEFLNDLIQRLCQEATVNDKHEMVFQPLDVTDKEEITYALNQVMAMDRSRRQLGRVMDYLDRTKKGGIRDRLQQWCHGRKAGEADGQYAWVFDNDHDTLIGTMGKALTTGFDTTKFLDSPTIRTPINMWLFHLTKSLVDGRRFAMFIAEFWKSLDDPYFGDFAKDFLKTLRKQNGFVVLDSQSASDAITHPHARTLIEQTATKILFPNPDAKYVEFATDEGLNCTEREYNLVKEEIPEGSRMFLIKQGHNSVVAKLDLKGFDYAISVLSARKTNIELLQRLMAQYGEEPEKWLPHFKSQRSAS